ncbi:hypothetical protein D9M68_718260 [compost metagenome]
MQCAGAFIERVAVVDPVLRGVGTDHPELSAVLFGLAVAGDIHLRGTLGQHRPAWLARPLHRDHVAPPAQPGELVDLVGVVATGVDGHRADRQLDAGDVPISRLEPIIEQHPGALVGGIARHHLKVHHPALQAFTPANDQQLQAVVLDVHCGGEDQRAGRDIAEVVGLGTILQLRGLGLFLGGVPDQCQAGVVEHLHRL